MEPSYCHHSGKETLTCSVTFVKYTQKCTINYVTCIIMILDQLLVPMTTSSSGLFRNMNMRQLLRYPYSPSSHYGISTTLSLFLTLPFNLYHPWHPKNNRSPLFLASTFFHFYSLFRFSSYSRIFHMCSDVQSQGQMLVAEHQRGYNCKQNKPSLSYSLFSPFSCPRVSIAYLRNLTVACRSRETILRAELQNVYISLYVFL